VPPRERKCSTKEPWWLTERAHQEEHVTMLRQAEIALQLSHETLAGVLADNPNAHFDTYHCENLTLLQSLARFANDILASEQLCDKS
jgi:hypothetical protein